MSCTYDSTKRSLCFITQINPIYLIYMSHVYIQDTSVHRDTVYNSPLTQKELSDNSCYFNEIVRQ